MPSLSITPILFFNLDFACLSLTVTTGKTNACSTWTSFFFFKKKDVSKPSEFAIDL